LAKVFELLVWKAELLSEWFVAVTESGPAGISLVEEKAWLPSSRTPYLFEAALAMIDRSRGSRFVAEWTLVVDLLLVFPVLELVASPVKEVVGSSLGKQVAWQVQVVSGERSALVDS
jgi:hypothetical protein